MAATPVLLVMVNVCEAETVLTVTLPKLKLVGDTPTAAAIAMPLMAASLFALPCTSRMIEFLAPTLEVGLNLTFAVQVADGKNVPTMQVVLTKVKSVALPPKIAALVMLAEPTPLLV
jgi:hypothetical protein